jgi:hypothetical protein
MKAHFASYQQFNSNSVGFQAILIYRPPQSQSQKDAFKSFGFSFQNDSSTLLSS